MTRIPESSKRFIDDSIRRIAAKRIVLDFGGGERFGKWLHEYRELFATNEYKTFDFDSSTGADIVGDIHDIPLEGASVDAIICSSVLEHVRDPRRAMGEMQRVLKPGGTMFFYVPSTYPYHARPGHYPDYWRFFEDTIRDLFSDFREIEIQKRGGYFLALSFFVPGQHRLRFLLTPLADFLDRALQTERRSTTAGYYVFATR